MSSSANNNPAKRNGISPPYSNAQIAAWMAVLLTLVEFGVVVTPILPPVAAIPLTFVFALLAVGVLYYGIHTQSIDPIDPHLVRFWKDTNQYEEAYPKQGGCAAALYNYYNRNTLQFQQTQNDNVDNSNNADAERPSTTLPTEPMKHCWICYTQVAENSMHCKSCNKCVYRFDRHCKWLNTCVGEANYKHSVRLLWFLVSLEITHFVVQVCLVVDSFQHGPTERRAEAWIGEIPTNAILLFFIMFSGISSFMLGQLLVFHIKLQRKGLTTYQFVVNDHAAKRIKAKQHGDREAKRARMIASASKKGYRVSLQFGGACRQMGCAACDPLQDENHEQQQQDSNDDDNADDEAKQNSNNNNGSLGMTTNQQEKENPTSQ